MYLCLITPSLPPLPGTNLTMTSLSPCTPGDGGHYAKLYPTNCVRMLEGEASDVEEQATPTKTPVTSLDTTGQHEVVCN